MGCVGSRHGHRRRRAPVEAADVDDTSSNVFYVQNVDDQGAELNEGQLAIERDKLVLHQRNGSAIEWPLRCLRRYGFNEELFSFESGRRCMTGPGIFAFKCRRAERLFLILQDYLQMSGQQLQHQRGGGGASGLVGGGAAVGVGAITAAGQPRRGLQQPIASLTGPAALVGSASQQQQQQPVLHFGLTTSAHHPPMHQRERYMEPPQASPQPPLHDLRPHASAVVVEPYMRPLSIRNGAAGSIGGVFSMHSPVFTDSVAAATGVSTAAAVAAAAIAESRHDSDSHTYMNGVPLAESHNYVNTNGCDLPAPGGGGSGTAAAVGATGAAVSDGRSCVGGAASGSSSGSFGIGGAQQPQRELNYADLDLPRSDDSPCRSQLRSGPGAEYLNVTGDLVFMDVCRAHSSSDEDDMFDPELPGYMNVVAAGAVAASNVSAPDQGDAAAAGSTSSRAGSMRRSGKQYEATAAAAGAAGGSKRAGPLLNYANLDCSAAPTWSAAAGLRKVNYSGDAGDKLLSTATKRGTDEKNHSQHYSQIDIKKTVALSAKTTNIENLVGSARKTRHDSSADDLQ